MTKISMLDSIDIIWKVGCSKSTKISNMFGLFTVKASWCDFMNMSKSGETPGKIQDNLERLWSGNTLESSRRAERCWETRCEIKLLPPAQEMDGWMDVAKVNWIWSKYRFCKKDLNKYKLMLCDQKHF